MDYQNDNDRGGNSPAAIVVVVVGRADDNLAHKEIRAVFPGEFALTIALTGWPNCNYVIIYVWYKV